jgi:glycerol-3-phosphate dehydrogenase
VLVFYYPAAPGNFTGRRIMPDYPFSDALPSALFDVVIAGAGVVGCALARRFTLEGARVLVLEKASDILEGASKGNSAILHTGFDAPGGSVEKQCIVDGYHEYLRIREKFNLPLLQCGALVLAWNEEQEQRLEAIVDAAHGNGIKDASILGEPQIRTMEPGLGPGVRAAVHVPGEYVIDPWSSPYAYLLQALQNGADLVRDCELLSGRFDTDAWRLQTDRGEIRGRFLINCSGLFGDRIDRSLLGEAAFEIRPRKGQFVVFDKSARALVNSILLPVPGEFSKGIVVCPTIFGNLLVGPTAEEQDSRTDAGVDAERLHMLRRRGSEILPALEAHSVTATYAGIRPATEYKDYQIRSYPERHYISVGGIRSTGLSAALGIAQRVHDFYAQVVDRQTALENYAWPRVPCLADPGPRDWQQPGNGGIVCHCELVTRREILAALDGPLAARSLGGLKRRTRVTMGRCQGFYCSGELSEMTADCFRLPLAEPRA